MTPRPRLRLLLRALGAILLLACGGGADAPPVGPPTPPPPATPPTLATITLAPDTLALEAIGRSGTVVASLGPVGATGSLTWRSSSPAIATVSGSGTRATVTAVGHGTATITASAGAIEGIATVIVAAVPQEIEQTVPATGGTVTLDIPGHPFEGLELTIPAGAFDGTTTWRVSTDTSPPRTFPRGATVLGPGLAIEGVAGSARNGQLLTMRVPVPSPPNDIVVIALVDPATGDFDLLPLIDRDSSSVTVMTRHLDARLFRSDAATALRRAPSVPAPFTFPSAASLLLRLKLPPEALKQANTNLDPQRHAWPVPEDGSAAFPRGHGSALAALQVAAAAIACDLQPLVRRHTGFVYADTAPLATVLITSLLQAQHELMLNAIREIGRGTVSPTQRSSFRLPDKALRDVMTALNLSAAMALTNRPQLMLKVQEGANLTDRGQQAWATAVSTDAAGHVNFLSPITEQVGVLGRLLLGEDGFADVQSKSLASDALPTSRDQIIAVPRALMDISDAERTLARMCRAMQAEGAARQEQSRALWRETNSREVEVRARRTSAADYAAVDAPLVVFDTAASLKLAVNEPAQVLMRFYDPTSGAQRLSASGTEDVAITALPGVQEAEDGESVTVEGAVVDNATGRQVVPLRFTVTRGRFALTEDTVELRPDSSVEMTAELTPPPAGGFVVHWDWGDGTRDTIPGLTTATHKYGDLGDYTVVATLRGPTDTVTLAADTADVVEPPGAWVGSVSGSRVNSDLGPDKGTVRFEATNVRWEYDPNAANTPGWRTYRVVSGTLSYRNEVPCASWVGPTLTENLAFGAFDSSFLVVSKSGEQVPGGGAAARWYYGQASVRGPRRLTNKLCATPGMPDPEEYIFSGAPIFFNAQNFSVSPEVQSTMNRGVLEGSYTWVSNNVVTTYSWRFERVP